MKAIKLRNVIVLALCVLTVFALTATVASAKSQKFSFSLKNYVTSGKNTGTWTSGSASCKAYGSTINPWDGNERYKCCLQRDAILNIGSATTAFYTANGTTYTKSATIGANGSYYPVVWLGRNISGSGTTVSGSGTWTK